MTVAVTAPDPPLTAKFVIVTPDGAVSAETTRLPSGVSGSETVAIWTLFVVVPRATVIPAGVGVIVGGCAAAHVVAHLGLPPPPMRIDILTAVVQLQTAAARLPAFASVLTQRMAELQPGQVVIVLLLPEGSGVVVASFALEDAHQGVSAPGGAA
jgi:hypothetical protein